MKFSLQKIVKKVVPAANRTVHDLSIRGSESYCVSKDNLVVHNCTTRHETGFTIPMFTCIRDISASLPQIPLIADGGCNHHGDIAKAIVAGASLVMAGSMFAACSDSPAPHSAAIKIKDGFEIREKLKVYYGSASYMNGNETNIEGTSRLLEEKLNTYLQELSDIKGALQSAASYGGCRTIQELRGKDIWRGR